MCRCRISWLFFSVLFLAPHVFGQTCVECHQTVTPQIVADWQTSEHSKQEVTCAVCHGADHTSAEDVAEVRIPTPEVCESCHPKQVEQFQRGKHSKAWAAMKAMPTIHFQPMSLTTGQKGCGGCHKIGLKSEAETAELKRDGAGFGLASCDACHTRHSFSKREAQQPQACQTCHTGFDHPQWEMYSGSKHGVRYLLRQIGLLPQTAPAPTCQTCHMQEGDHAVRTAWGFLAVRLPMPEDAQWAADRASILQGLGVLDPDGQPTARLEVAKAADVVRLTQEDWQGERDKMARACGQCHSSRFAQAQLAHGDEMIRQADRLMAQGIRVVADLYRDRVLSKPESYTYAFPDLLAFHDTATPIEQRLWVMYLEHRMRTFQGAFHMNPDYTLWYGWSEMQRDLTEIKAMGEELRRRARQPGG